MADAGEAAVEVEQGLGRTVKDLVSGAAGGIAQVLIGKILSNFLYSSNAAFAYEQDAFVRDLNISREGTCFHYDAYMIFESMICLFVFLLSCSSQDLLYPTYKDAAIPFFTSKRWVSEDIVSLSA